MTTLITNIKQLVNTRENNHLLKGKDLALLPCIKNAFLLIEDDTIAAYGQMSELEHKVAKMPSNTLNAEGQFVLPAWCDSHTHIVFAGSRENEFVDKINGLSYAEIAAKGGGILNSAAKLQQASEDELFNQAWARLQEISRLGTGAIEIKSGYGRTGESELNIVRVIKGVKEKSSITKKSSFFEAHMSPLAY